MRKHAVQFLMLLTILLAASGGYAGSKPQVTRVDAVYVDAGASMRIQWQSEEPVMKAYISIGTERRTVEVDFRDNRRNPSGFSGEATALIPMSPGMAGASAYTVQVEDEFRTKSELVTGVVAGQRQQTMPVPDDTWGQDRLTRPGSGIPGQPGVSQGGMIPPASPGMMPPPAMFPPPQTSAGMAPPPLPMNQGMVPQQTLPVYQGGIPSAPPPMPVDPGMMPPPPPPPPPPPMPPVQ